MKDWGKVFLATRLEKMVESDFFEAWSYLITKGLRPGDVFSIIKDRTAHMAANEAVSRFLKSNCDSLFFLDSDANIGFPYLEELRTLEDGYEYDIFQGFYTRRGWPPEAIWFKETELGDLVQCLVWKDNNTEETAMAGLHNTLIRREVFEAMLADNPAVKVEDFHFFFYPRHIKSSEDGAFCKEARRLGFRIGSTTKCKAGHITRVTTGWQSYQDYLKYSGIYDLWGLYYNLIELVATFTGESYDTVIAKAIRGKIVGNSIEAFANTSPKNPDEYREYYGMRDSYLYDLISWNVSPFYQKIIAPLKGIKGMRVLVIGAGLGTEAEAMAAQNQVDIFELPGELRDFCRFRLNGSVGILETDTLLELTRNDDLMGEYDLIVAIDVLEHIHPDEFEGSLNTMLWMLAEEGAFYLHNNFKEPTPQAFDHSEKFTEWMEWACMKQEGEYLWKRE